MKKLSIEERLNKDVFHVDEEDSHIVVDFENCDPEDLKKLLIACPAHCYTYVDGKPSFSHLGCLECGTCRVLCGGTIVKEWHHPAGGVGVTYKQG